MANRIKGLHIPYRMTLAGGYPDSAEDVDLLGMSITEILKTGVGERVRNRAFGSYLHRLIFSGMGRAALTRAKTEARRAIEAWEGRVEVDDVLAHGEDSRIILEIVWRPAGTIADSRRTQVGFDVGATA
jgi:phage baseplate assembly protein W